MAFVGGREVGWPSSESFGGDGWEGGEVSRLYRLGEGGECGGEEGFVEEGDSFGDGGGVNDGV